MQPWDTCCHFWGTQRMWKKPDILKTHIIINVYIETKFYATDSLNAQNSFDFKTLWIHFNLLWLPHAHWYRDCSCNTGFNSLILKSIFKNIWQNKENRNKQILSKEYIFLKINPHMNNFNTELESVILLSTCPSSSLRLEVRAIAAVSVGS